MEPNKNFEILSKDQAPERKKQHEQEHSRRTQLRHRTLTDEEMWAIVEREQQDRMEQ